MSNKEKNSNLNDQDTNLSSCGDIIVINEKKVRIICKFCKEKFTKVATFTKHVIAIHWKFRAIQDFEHATVSEQGVVSVTEEIEMTDKEKSIEDYLELENGEIEDEYVGYMKSEIKHNFIEKIDDPLDVRADENLELDENDNFLESGIETSNFKNNFNNELQKIEDETVNSQKQLLNVYERVNILRRIVQENRNKKKRNYKCEICEKIYPKPSQLFYHFDSHLKSDVFLADKIDVLKEEILRQKWAKSVHKCEICGRVFTESNRLLKHFKVHERKKPPVNKEESIIKYQCKNVHKIFHKCKICNQIFDYAKDWKNHMLLHGDVAKNPYKCIKCSKSYVRKVSLIDHIRYVHLQKRDYVCPQCDKNFMRSDLLAIHIRTHTGDKPFVCEVCGSRYYSNSLLTLHQNRHNTANQQNTSR